MELKFKLAVWRLKHLRGFTMPENLSSISPLEYRNHISRWRSKLIENKALSEQQLQTGLRLLLALQLFAERQVNIIRSHLGMDAYPGTDARVI